MVKDGLATNVGLNPSGADALFALAAGRRTACALPAPRCCVSGGRAGQRAAGNGSGAEGRSPTCLACPVAAACLASSLAACGSSFRTLRRSRRRPGSSSNGSWSPNSRPSGTLAAAGCRSTSRHWNCPRPRRSRRSTRSSRSAVDLYQAGSLHTRLAWPSARPAHRVRPNSRSGYRGDAGRRQGPRRRHRRRPRKPTTSSRSTTARPVDVIWAERSRGGGLDHERNATEDGKAQSSSSPALALTAAGLRACGGGEGEGGEAAARPRPALVRPLRGGTVGITMWHMEAASNWNALSKSLSAATTNLAGRGEGQARLSRQRGRGNGRTHRFSGWRRPPSHRVPERGEHPAPDR